MEIEIQLFGITKEIFGGQTYRCSVSENATVADLLAEVKKTHPQLDELRSLKVAVNEVYASEDTVLTPQDDIVFIPPVSGG